jgi:error-prone DNA polymerase
MLEKGYAPEFAERIFKQIQGFGEYGFPESHAASFALLVYASAWIKRWHPDTFLAALLNSQPMGFYAPAQLVRDACEHGVTVLPVDVLHSAWDTVLEPLGMAASAQAAAPMESPQESVPTAGTAGLAGQEAAGVRDRRFPVPAGLLPVRLGFSRIAGFPADAAQRLVAAREAAAFDSIEDLARRAQLDARQLQLLARSDALGAITGHRRQAAWVVAGVDTRATPMLRRTRTHEAAVALPAADAASQTLDDYRATGLSLKSHPLALLRPQLSAFRVLTAAQLQCCRPGQLARASGIVTHRQRPGTAKGVVFVTLEDETGHVNIIVWPAIAQAQRRPLLASRLLTVYGIWQREGEVMHLVARRLVDHTPLLQGLAARSRDFH